MFDYCAYAYEPDRARWGSISYEYTDGTRYTGYSTCEDVHEVDVSRNGHTCWSDAENDITWAPGGWYQYNTLGLNPVTCDSDSWDSDYAPCTAVQEGDNDSSHCCSCNVAHMGCQYEIYYTSNNEDPDAEDVLDLSIRSLIEPTTWWSWSFNIARWKETQHVLANIADSSHSLYRSYYKWPHSSSGAGTLYDGGLTGICMSDIPAGGYDGPCSPEDDCTECMSCVQQAFRNSCARCTGGCNIRMGGCGDVTIPHEKYRNTDSIGCGAEPYLWPGSYYEIVQPDSVHCCAQCDPEFLQFLYWLYPDLIIDRSMVTDYLTGEIKPSFQVRGSKETMKKVRDQVEY